MISHTTSNKVLVRCSTFLAEIKPGKTIFSLLFLFIRLEKPVSMIRIHSY